MNETGGKLMPIHWTHLGSPTHPGLVAVDGSGKVEIGQYHIKVAMRHGGRCSFMIDDVDDNPDADGCRYRLGRVAYRDED
jgi:hypothetical protein